MRKGRLTWRRSTFEVTEGGFLEIYSSKIVENNVFLGQETLFEEHSSPMSLLPGPGANKSGSHKLQIVNNCLTNVRMPFWSVQMLQPHDLRKMETNSIGQKWSQQTRPVLGGHAYSIYGEQNPLILFHKQ